MYIRRKAYHPAQYAMSRMLDALDRKVASTSVEHHANAVRWASAWAEASKRQIKNADRQAGLPTRSSSQ